MIPSDHSWVLQEQTTKNSLTQFVSSTTCVDLPDSFAQFDQFFQDEYQESLDPSIWKDIPCIFVVEESLKSYTIPCEVTPGKFLHVNAGLTKTQQEKLLKFLEKKIGAFASEYTDMKGIHPNTCVHHIYTDVKINPVRQPTKEDEPSTQGYS